MTDKRNGICKATGMEEFGQGDGTLKARENGITGWRSRQ